MEKSSMKMDLGEWELLDAIPDTGKDSFSDELHFDPHEIIDLDYFICPSNDPMPIIDVGKDFEVVPQVFKGIGVMPPMMIVDDQDAVGFQVLPKELKDESLPPIEQKKEACKEYKFGVGYKEQEFSKNYSEYEKGEAEVGKKTRPWWEGFGLKVWSWRLNCSIGVAAATICMIMLGGRHHDPHHHNHSQKLQFQIYTDDKSINQVMQQATKLNQALYAVRNGPITRAHMSFGGYYDGL